jgi:hypothetical protein
MKRETPLAKMVWLFIPDDDEDLFRQETGQCLGQPIRGYVAGETGENKKSLPTFFETRKLHPVYISFEEVV